MFSDHEKARIRHFLGYPSWSNLASSIQLGVPSGSQPLFILEQSFNRILPDGEETVRKDLCECESVERQISDARKRKKAQQLGTLRVNPREMHDLIEDLEFWTRRLADDLGVVKNPYGSMSYHGMPGASNARVVG